jgi:hypothetical protein
VVDANPEDIDLVDFVRPDGTQAKVSLGDYRQLVDSTFHAGTGPGVVSEHVDEANGLHFYVLDIARDDEGVLSYRVAVRATAGSRPVSRAVSVEATAAAGAASPGYVGQCAFDVTNGSADVDLVRFQAVSDRGWPTTLRRDVGDIPAGGSESVPVHVQVPPGTRAGTTSTVTLTASSETSAAATEAATCQLRAASRAAAPPPGPAQPPSVVDVRPLPATGGEELVALAGLALLAAGAVARRRLAR